MKPSTMDELMRRLEYFHSIRLLPETWPIVRVDGRGFTRLTSHRFDKPYDDRFRDLMVKTAEALLRELQGLYAYTESDEVSVLLPKGWDLFDRELEKTVSLSAAIASAIFSLALGSPAQFDSRVWLGPSEDLVVDYFRWRQEDAARSALNGWAYWTLRKEGKSAAEATAALHRTSVAFKNELLFRRGINFNDLPAWQRRGVGLYWERYEKRGWDPLAKKEVVASRRRIKVDTELPMKEAYARLIRDRLSSAATGIES